MRLVVAFACMLFAVPAAHAQTSDSTAARTRWRAYDQLERAGVPVERASVRERCIADDSLSVRSLIETGLFPVELIQDDVTLLQAASLFGAEKCATTLLNLGAQVDFDPALNGTPLGYAARNGHVEVVRLLLSRGASPTASPSGIFSDPLSMAASRGQIETLRLLLDTGAPPNFALHSAISSNQGTTVRWLVQRMRPQQMEFAYWIACTQPQPRTTFLRIMERAGFSKTCQQIIAEFRADIDGE